MAALAMQAPPPLPDLANFDHLFGAAADARVDVCALTHMHTGDDDDDLLTTRSFRPRWTS